MTLRSALFILWCLANFNALAQNRDSTKVIVPLGGNGWLNKNASAKIESTGVSNWTTIKDTVTAYVRFEATGDAEIALRLNIPSGKSKIEVRFDGKTFIKTSANPQDGFVTFGKVDIKSPGYKKISITGISKTGEVFANLYDIVLTGPALKGAAYVKNNQGNYFYWGHRGPSVHLNYKVPEEVKDNIEWFYNEVTVPAGNDVLGSYFMADGFSGGYFGMQVNSSTERHVLFSIWSPFTTDDPKKIPDSLKIVMLKKGAAVHTGEFGSEGSGGQSYLNYPWVAGKTYAFLIHAQANAGDKTTIFTAYFKEVNQPDWKLIASFKRPKSGIYLKGLYSFLENFEPETGNVTRKVNFGNQWTVDTNGKWYAVNNATFTGDATANINYRKDYSGGVEGKQFYLRNCGFFDDFTLLKSPLMRKPSDKPHPQIDFAQLP